VVGLSEASCRTSIPGRKSLILLIASVCSFTVLDLAVPLTNSRTMQWYEDEDFWREMYNYMFPAEKFSAAEEQVSQNYFPHSF
jgi:hypothetical protein